MSTREIDFKDTKYAAFWLETALEMEKAKYAECPVKNDLVPGYINAQAWGYVVAGYFLLEQSLKLLLHVRAQSPGMTHILSSDLFERLPDEDKDILRESYRDFRSAGENANPFPFSELDEFLSNLDGGEDSRGRHVGSFDWRYFLIENAQGGELPTVSIEFLHEIIDATINLASGYGEGTYSQRQFWERQIKYRDWLEDRMEDEKKWNDLGDRLELVWGPDYRNRYDYYIFRAGDIKLCFAEIPANHGLTVKDLRKEVAAFGRQ